MGTIMELRINGTAHKIELDGDRKLLGVLRDELDLTGTKYGCGESRCGACTVLVEGQARRACVTIASTVAGKEVTTIEGIARGGQLHPVQEAFLELNAFQCGYCTPGMILAGVALLQRNPTPSEQEIAHALEGNICRCGAYPRILAAVSRAAQYLKEAGQ